MKPTRKPSVRDRLLDVAEDVFGKRGYDASSLEEIAGAIGIGASAIYRHYRNKMALYEAVVDRLARRHLASLESFEPEINGVEFSGRNFRYHAEHPALARIVVQASIAGGEQRRIVVEKLIQPAFRYCNQKMRRSALVSARELVRNPSHYMAFVSLMYGYVNLAPLFRDAVGFDPLAEWAVSDGVDIVEKFAWSLNQEAEEGFARHLEQRVARPEAPTTRRAARGRNR
ncbi:MAG: hypothetical protein NAOJABEB_03087 [Steroidobacteraceae bacterium]|nr:hypothetical protein [Steroidobacteraceae bacterium]